MSQMTFQKIHYQSGSVSLEGVLVFDAVQSQPRPCLVMAPNWMGVTDRAVTLAEKVAEQGYVVLIADLYGAGIRPTDADEAGKAMMEVKDTPAEVGRMQSAMNTLLTQSVAPVQKDKIATFGFCFGGHCALELARSGAELKGVVSFHGGLDTCGDYDAAKIKGAVLVLDGAGDPLVPREQIPAFVSEMSRASVDWTLTSYHGAVHSFTDQSANSPGVAEYNADVAERAFQEMFRLLKRVC